MHTGSSKAWKASMSRRAWPLRLSPGGVAMSGTSVSLLPKVRKTATHAGCPCGNEPIIGCMHACH